jgi:DNA polymerase III delta subunit
VDHGAFVRLAERGQLPAVVLVHGGDGVLVDDVLALVTRTLFPDAAAAAFDRESFDAREVDVATVLSAASTLPVLAAARLVVARHAQAWPAKAAEAVTRYAKDPNPAAVLLLLADESLRPGRDRRAAHWLLEAVPPSSVVEPAERRGRGTEEWLRQRAAMEGLTVSAEAARVLVDAIGEEPALLLGEVRKAALAGGADNRTVGVNEVNAVVGQHRIADVFQLLGAIERRDVGAALRTLDRLLATEAAIPVLVMLTREVRATWQVREWQRQGRRPDDIVRLLRPRPPMVAQALMAAATAAAPESLARRLRRCWDVEQRLKSSGEPRGEMAALVAELAT